MGSTDANLDESRDSEQDAVPRSESAWRRTRFNIAIILIATACVLVVIWLVARGAVLRRVGGPMNVVVFA